MSDEPSAAGGQRVARNAVLATAGLYGGYALLGAVGFNADLRYLGLIAAFYFLPQFMLRRDPQRQQRYQVGPGAVIPRWSWRGAKTAGIAVAIIFPLFIYGFFWFYSRVCPGDLGVLSSVLWIEGLTPAAGGLETYLERLCTTHNHGFWPVAWRLPEQWMEYGGAGVVLAVAIEVFAIALPEEVFHRGYLMSALEEWVPPKTNILGAPLGVAALLSSLMFALGHLVGMAEVARLATFFPALLFSWLWRRSGSLWAPALVHAASNLLMAILLASTFPR